MFSAVLGLAGSIYGANKASQDAAAARADQRYMQDQQMQLAYAQLGLEADARREQREENEYQRMMERINRRMAADEREFEIDQLNFNKDQLLEQRRMDIERQIDEDKEAARMSQFRLETLLRNQDLAEEERAFAIEQLEYVKSIAAGERDEEMRRFLEDRETAKIEREFMTQQFMDARDQRMMERNQDLAIRDQAMLRILNMQDALQGAYTEMGPAPTIDQVTQADIDAEINRRTGQYISDVDRAADRVASVNEANLIRQGLDASTPGTARRGEVAGRLAQEYQNARSRAYDDALKYIRGESDTLASSAGDIMKLRSGQLGEIGSVAGAGISELSRLPQVASATDAYRYASMVPSSILNRSISSANSFRAPVNIGTAMTSGDLLPSLADYRSPTSAASNYGFNIDSAIFNPYSVGMPQPGGSSAASIFNNLGNQASSYADAMRQRSAQASAGFGSQFNKFLNDASSGPTYGIKGVTDSGDPIYGETNKAGFLYNVDKSVNDFFGKLF